MLIAVRPPSLPLCRSQWMVLYALYPYPYAGHSGGINQEESVCTLLIITVLIPIIIFIITSPPHYATEHHATDHH